MGLKIRFPLSFRISFGEVLHKVIPHQHAGLSQEIDVTLRDEAATCHLTRFMVPYSETQTDKPLTTLRGTRPGTSFSFQASGTGVWEQRCLRGMRSVGKHP